jgi:catechol 2,3-dioxygenase-like lactoylglutathione lyase family enzyme
MKRALLPLTLVAILGIPAFAELAPQNEAGVTTGHVHLAVKDIAAHKTFWVDVLGGKLVKNGPLEMIEFPGVYIMLRQSDTATSAVGTFLDHIGFSVKDYAAAEAKWKARNLKVEHTENPTESYVFGPDDVKVEIYEDATLEMPIRFFHFHYYTTEPGAVQAWYAKALGGALGERACIACISRPSMVPTVNVPGANLTFNTVKNVLPATKGRSLDHIGFEVKNLETYIKRLEAEGIKLDEPVRQVPNTRVKIAFLSDPWGTRIELSENLPPAKY